jgi:SAM-dependent methyltransferase
VTKYIVADDGAGNTNLLAQSWRANAARWSRAVREGKIESRKCITNSAILNAILRHNPSSVLDLGCGEGWLCRALASQVPYRTGIDASPELVSLAQAIGGADFVTLGYADFIANPLALGSRFDVIAANFSLLDECAEDLFTALGRVVRSGGKLVVQTLHPWNVDGEYRTGWRTERFESLGSEEWAPMPWFFRTLENWMSAFGKTWRLDSIEEPCVDNSSFPVSLIMTASKESASSANRRR